MLCLCFCNRPNIFWHSGCLVAGLICLRGPKVSNAFKPPGKGNFPRARAIEPDFPFHMVHMPDCSLKATARQRDSLSGSGVLRGCGGRRFECRGWLPDPAVEMIGDTKQIACHWRSASVPVC